MRIRGTYALGSLTVQRSRDFLGCGTPLPEVLLEACAGNPLRDVLKDWKCFDQVPAGRECHDDRQNLLDEANVLVVGIRDINAVGNLDDRCSERTRRPR